MTNSVSGGWREVYAAQAVRCPDDPSKWARVHGTGSPVPSQGFKL